jgi:hypothetical protein
LAVVIGHDREVTMTPYYRRPRQPRGGLVLRTGHR